MFEISYAERNDVDSVVATLKMWNSWAKNKKKPFWFSCILPSFIHFPSASSRANFLYSFKLSVVDAVSKWEFCRHSLVDPSAPTILQPRIQIPSTTSTLQLYNFNLNCNVKKTKINTPDWMLQILRQVLTFYKVLFLRHLLLVGWSKCFSQSEWLKLS